MSQQIEEGSIDAVLDDLESFFAACGTSFSQATKGLSVCSPPELDKGTSSGLDSSVLATRGPSGLSYAGLIEDIKRTNLRKVINRSIIVTDSNEGALQIAGAISSAIASNRNCGTSSFVAFVPHKGPTDPVTGRDVRPHVHVWHDCNPIQNMCRCALLSPYRGSTRQEGMLANRKSIPGFRPLRSVPTEEARKTGDAYFERLFKYFPLLLVQNCLPYLLFRYIVSRQGARSNEKGAIYNKGGRWELSTTINEATSLFTKSAVGAERDEICDGYEVVDTTQGVFVDGNAKRPREDFESLELPSMGNSRQCGKFKKPAFEPIRINKTNYLKVEEMLQTYIYSPPNLICKSTYWVNDPICKIIPDCSQEFKLAIDNWMTNLAHWTFDQFQEFYKVQRHYVFRPGRTYHSVKDSVKYAKLWIEEQCKVASLNHWDGAFGYRKIAIDERTFLQKISDVVNRRVVKRFGFVFQSEVNSCGKTWFTDMIIDYYLNKGELNNWSRYRNCNFPFMGLVNRRIALWNEGILNGDDDQKEELKKFLEGTSFTVSVKNKGDGHVMRVPCIITTNNKMFEKLIGFRDRLTIVNIAPVPMMHGGPGCPGQMHLHPFAWPILLNHYNVETNELGASGAEEITSLTNFICFENDVVNVE